MIDSFWIAFIFGMLGGLVGLRLTAGGSHGHPLFTPVFDWLFDRAFGRNCDEAVLVGIGGMLLVTIVVGLHFAYAYSG